MDIENPLTLIEQQISSLESEKLKLEHDERYSEADDTAKRIFALRTKLKKKQSELLQSSHINERESLEKNYQSEQTLLNQTWDSVINAYQEKCDKELEDFKKKHQQELINEKTRLESTLHMFFKPSTSLLNMTKCKEKAVRLGKYAEAQILLNQIEEAKAFEESRFMELKRSAVEQGLCNFEQGYDKKLLSLRKRHQTGLNELNLQRTSETEVLLKKYEHLRRVMENSQQIMKNIHEGKHTTAAGRHHESPMKSLYSTYSGSPSARKNLDN